MMFELDNAEVKKAMLFCRDHICNHRDSPESATRAGVIGGAYTYSFTPTALGTITEIKCICGKKEVLTDFEEW